MATITLSRGFVRGYTFQFNRGAGPIVEAVNSVQKGILPWGAGHHAKFRRLNGHRVGLSAICEDLPEQHNRVTLDPVMKDAHGIPAPKIDYTISDNSNRMLDHAIARASEFLREAGAWDIGVERPILNGGWHLLGTARMGDGHSTWNDGVISGANKLAEACGVRVGMRVPEAARLLVRRKDPTRP